MKDSLKNMKETLISAAQGQMGNLDQVNAKELGEVIDMIKDLEEACYYCSIVEAMDKNKEEAEISTLMARLQPQQMYYDGRRPVNYQERYPRDIENREGRDYREGISPMSRKGYMESKELHRDKNIQIQELEKYMNELSQDITEMINGASPEEKTMLQQKLNMLAQKIK